MNYAVIMAGGAGTRLWPMSRSGTPKQLIPFLNGRSLLHLAATRLGGLIEPANLFICTGAAYAPAILADLGTLPTPLQASQILGEPMGRDTANAVGFAAAVLQRLDPEATLAILTADHVITPVERFQAALRTAFAAVEARPEFLVTFGITPSFPATGYGYIQRGPEIADLPGVHRVLAFKEKPKEDLAQQYVASGQYAWNSGMFVWKAATILEQLRQQLPASYEGLMMIAEAWGTPEQAAVLQAVYPKLPKISIDFAVMEKAPHVATVAMGVQWLDIGSWPSFAETLPADAAGNRSGGGVAQFVDSTNTLTVSEDPEHLIATINTRDLIIIHTPRATLVCPAKDAERIKQLVAELQQRFGGKYV